MAQLLLVAVLLAGMAQAVAAQGGSRPVITKLPNGSVRVMSPGPTAWSDTNGWKLVLERTVQPPESDAGVLQNPWEALVTADGWLITSDNQQNPAIRLYDKSGKFVRLLGRMGDGPGEYRVPFIALFHDTLIIHDPQPLRLTVMTLDGKVVRESRTTGNDYYPIYVDAKGRIAMRISSRVAGRVRANWVYFTRQGVRSDSILVPSSVDNKMWEYSTLQGKNGAEIPFGPATIMHLLPDGTAVYGNTDRYELIVTRTGTDTVRVFGRINPPLARIPTSIRDSAFHAVVDRREALRKVANLSDVPLTFQPWRTLQHDGAGNIWVGARSERPQQLRFDVFRPDGAFLGSVVAPFNASATITFHGDRVTVIDTDADDLPRIRIYRVETRGH